MCSHSPIIQGSFCKKSPALQPYNSSVLQCVAVCCARIAVYYRALCLLFQVEPQRMSIVYTSHVHCNTLQHTATHGYTLLHAALQHTATHCNTRAYIKGLFRILHSVGQQQKKNCCRRNLIANKNSFVRRKNFVVERKLLRFFCKREIFFV